MKNYLLKLPIPVAAIGLSFAGLAGLFAKQPILKNICFITSCLIILSVVIKFLLSPKQFKEQLNQGPVAATFPTFFMAIAFLSKLFLPLNYYLALLLWSISVLGHAYCIISFTKKFALKRELSLILPSWFIVYVGIVASAIAAPVFNLPLLMKISQFILGFGFISFLILLFLVIKRIKTIPIPEPLQATFAILAAPAALNLVGYLAITTNKSLGLISLQFGLVLLLYLIVLVNLIKLLKKDFSPAQAALTFPLVISATAIKQGGGALVLNYTSLAMPIMILSYFALIVAVCVVLIILIRFLNNTSHNAKK